MFIFSIEQSWIHLMIGQEDARWWIGIEAEQDEDDANQWTWKWESGDPIEYSNWGYGEPSINFYFFVNCINNFKYLFIIFFTTEIL